MFLEIEKLGQRGKLCFLSYINEVSESWTLECVSCGGLVEGTVVAPADS